MLKSLSLGINEREKNASNTQKSMSKKLISPPGQHRQPQIKHIPQVHNLVSQNISVVIQARIHQN